MNVMYICDGKNIHCSKTWCKYNGTGTCKHTMSEFYAKYGAAENITADRFAICDDMAIEIDREDSQPEVGRWIYDKNIDNWRCSECGETPKTMGYCGSADFMAEHFKYCNHCGCKMQGVEE